MRVKAFKHFSRPSMSPERQVHFPTIAPKKKDAKMRPKITLYSQLAIIQRDTATLSLRRACPSCLPVNVARTTSSLSYYHTKEKGRKNASPHNTFFSTCYYPTRYCYAFATQGLPILFARQCRPNDKFTFLLSHQRKRTQKCVPT